MNEQNCIKCQQLEEQQKEDNYNDVGIGTTEAALQVINIVIHLCAQIYGIIRLFAINHKY
jgi:hypothetical protein